MRLGSHIEVQELRVLGGLFGVVVCQVAAPKRRRGWSGVATEKANRVGVGVTELKYAVP